MATATDSGPQTGTSYRKIRNQLSPPQTPIPIFAHGSSRPHHPDATSQIAELQVHPTLEAYLHILNNDLSSAHFLVRQMESPPKYEGMMLHAVLHRIEGDIANARCWYYDVRSSDVFHHVWEGGQQDESHYKAGPGMKVNVERDKVARSRSALPQELTTFLDRVERLRLSTIKGSVHPLPEGVDSGEEKRELSKRSDAELEKLQDWCSTKFGAQRIIDARDAFTSSGEDGQQREEISDKKSRMLMGGEGFRQF